MNEEIVLFDLPSQEPCQAWSGNSLKTRLALNYKGIPYKTEWIPYIHLQETLRSKGIPSNPPGSFADYTIPTIQLRDGTFVMDSAKIAVKLEDLYPKPSLHLNSDLEAEVSTALGLVFRELIPYLLPRFRKVVAPIDHEWFEADRTRRFGMSPAEMEKQKGAQVAIDAAGPYIRALAQLLGKYKKNEGPFLMGTQVCYADFIVVASMHMFKRVGDDAFEVFIGGREDLRGWYKACEPWLKKID